MTTPAEMQALVEKLVVNMGRFQDIINGPADGPGSLVEIDGSEEVPTIAKAIQSIQLSAAIDGSEPLRIREFVEISGGDHRLALQTAIDVMYAEDGGYRGFLDLQGFDLVIDGPVVIPAAPNYNRYIFNGQIRTTAEVWTGGNYLIDATAAGGGTLNLSNIRIAGASTANWITFDNMTLVMADVDCFNNKTDQTPGILSGATGVLMIRGGRWVAPDSASNPTARQRVGFETLGGGNTISDLNAAGFRVLGVLRGSRDHVENIHIDATVTGAVNVPNHTPGLKFTGGSVGTMVSDLWLTECYVEISNQHNSSASSVGGIFFSGTKAVANSGDAGFAYFVARDYHDRTGLTINGVTITDGSFANQGSARALLTAVTPGSQSFNNLGHNSIYAEGNRFVQNIAKQANPISILKTFASLVQHPFEIDGLLPFGGAPNAVLSVVSRPASGSGGNLSVGNINRSTKVARIDTAGNWAGDITITVTMNLPDSDGVVQT